MALTLGTIRDQILVRSGQFLLGSTNIELNDANFKLLVDAALGTYNKYSPSDQRMTIDIAGQFYTFASPNDIPDWIPACLPLGTYSGSLGAVFNQLQQKEYGGALPTLIAHRYVKPTLYVPYDGPYDITAAYNIKVVPESGQTPIIANATVNLELEDDSFFNLLLGMFLVALGRSRRMITMTDWNATMDGESLTAEGQQLIDTTMESMKENSKWWLAIGVP